MKSCTSLSLNQELKTPELDEEVHVKVETGRELGLWCRIVSQAVTAKEKFPKEATGATPVKG